MPVPPPVIAVVPLAGSEAAVTDSVSPASGAKVSLARGSTGLGPESSTNVAASSRERGGARIIQRVGRVVVGVGGRDGDGGRVRLAVAVGDRVGEGVGAGEVAIWG